MSDRSQDLARIEAALLAASQVFRGYRPEEIAVRRKAGGDPVTEYDQAIDDVLHRLLPASGEGWLSEETVDDASRLGRRRVWVVDPLDGTKEFVQGIPEWCISVGLVEDGEPVAGGICNPATGEIFLGAFGLGVRLNGREVAPSSRRTLLGATVLASRSECSRGEWDRFGSDFQVTPMGSVAYKLARVAAGLADATWTLVPKHEWDVAGGAALVKAAGGMAAEWPVQRGGFNRPDSKLTGFYAVAPGLAREVCEMLDLPERAAGPVLA